MVKGDNSPLAQNKQTALRAITLQLAVNIFHWPSKTACADAFEQEHHVPGHPMRHVNL
jgi:hypothetical protein